MKESFQVTWLLGRCANGSERDSGKVRHAREGRAWQALCGVNPGRRSAGWHEYMLGEPRPSLDQVTCPKCRRALRAQMKIQVL